jgi:elongation factor Ts
MELTAKLVMSLRDKTLLPMMKCKEALNATLGKFDTEDAWIDGAIEHLRKQGIGVNKNAGKEATNGGIGMQIFNFSDSGSLPNSGSIVLLGCQTDFVSNNELFKELANNIATSHVSYTFRTSLNEEKFPEDSHINHIPLLDLLKEKSAQLGETLSVISVKSISGDVVVGYNHGGRVAALVSGTGNEEKLHNVALHVVAANPPPIALDRNSVDPVLVAKEKEILSALPDVQGKPDAMKEKIVTGKLGRFYKERVLLEQEMLIDAEKKETVEQYLKRHGLIIKEFARLEVAR